jgi:hypothetical protein
MVGEIMGGDFGGSILIIIQQPLPDGHGSVSALMVFRR